MIIFRFPFGSDCYTIKNNSTYTDSVDFVSFDEKTKISFNGKAEKLPKSEIKSIFSSELEKTISFENEDKTQYLEKINEVIRFIKENDLKKLVISRKKSINFTENIDLSETFLNLCEAYPNAFVYLMIKDNECWLGAFSEILGKFQKATSEFQTMSLAGTLPIDENWTEKEIKEQQPVTDYIHHILKNYSAEISVSKTTEHISGKIKHLRTDFSTKIKTEKLNPLIADLHPTPAVCGVPKDFCKTAIQHFESHDRELYSGYIRVENETEISYFVNLRCAKISKNELNIFVGGGITAQSQPEKEWRETELKTKAILDNLALV